jgi:hypothetical protein
MDRVRADPVSVRKLELTASRSEQIVRVHGEGVATVLTAVVAIASGIWGLWATGVALVGGRLPIPWIELYSSGGIGPAIVAFVVSGVVGAILTYGTALICSAALTAIHTLSAHTRARR